MKKILAVLCATVLSLTLSLPVLAENPASLGDSLTQGGNSLIEGRCPPYC